MALLIEDAEAEAAQEQQPARVRGRLKRRDSAVLRGEKLTEEQITQVLTTRPLLAQPAFSVRATQRLCRFTDWNYICAAPRQPLISGLTCNSVTPECPALMICLSCRYMRGSHRRLTQMGQG